MIYKIGEIFQKGLPGYYDHVSMPVGVGYNVDSNRPIVFWIGHGNSNVGGDSSALEAVKDEKRTLRHLKLAGAAWFMFYIRRIAEGNEAKYRFEYSVPHTKDKVRLARGEGDSLEVYEPLTRDYPNEGDIHYSGGGKQVLVEQDISIDAVFKIENGVEVKVWDSIDGEL